MLLAQAFVLHRLAALRRQRRPATLPADPSVGNSAAGAAALAEPSLVNLASLDCRHPQRFYLPGNAAAMELLSDCFALVDGVRLPLHGQLLAAQARPPRPAPTTGRSSALHAAASLPAAHASPSGGSPSQGWRALHPPALEGCDSRGSSGPQRLGPMHTAHSAPRARPDCLQAAVLRDMFVALARPGRDDGGASDEGAGDAARLLVRRQPGAPVRRQGLARCRQNKTQPARLKSLRLAHARRRSVRDAACTRAPALCPARHAASL